MKLFNSFGGAGYHTSIITSFSVDLDAYESIVLPRMREAGCNNNILIADARMLGHAMTDGARVPKFAGRRYSVVAAQSSGVFHPKIVLQLGKSSARLLVASANVTAAGLAGNLEVVGEVLADEQNRQFVPVIRAALDYLVGLLPEVSVPKRQLDWALRRSRWLLALPPGEPVVRLNQDEVLGFLSSNSAEGIGARFVGLVGARPVKRLIVISPYWDTNLGALRELRQSFHPARTTIFIQPQTALFPVHAWKQDGMSALYDIGCVKGSSRFAHAKVVIAETADGDCILYGSANCTQAALGKSGEPGTNDETCLYRELPPGEAVKLLGLEAALLDSELKIEDLPDYLPGEDIPLEDLERRLPGRFELSGELLRWWPPSGISPSSAAFILLDHEAKEMDAGLTRIGSLEQPITFHFHGSEAPFFALVRFDGGESSLAAIVVEEAIQETQRRKVTKGIESALALLEDEPYEGLWIFEVIQKIGAAEHDGRELQPDAKGSQKPIGNEQGETLSRKLTYEQFIAGRKAASTIAARTGSHLASSHQESVRTFLNALIGKRSSPLVPEDDDASSLKRMWSLGDETADGDQALDEDERFNSDAQQLTQSTSANKRLRLEHQRMKDSQAAIVGAVGKFIELLRQESLSRSLGVLELLRLRVLIMVVLGAGSEKSRLLPNELNGNSARWHVLPSHGDLSWRRLIGQLLFGFFRNHGGTKRPLIEKVVLDFDSELGLPDDVLECWATCFWAVCATRVARDEMGRAFQLPENEQKIAQDLYRYTRLLPVEALSQAVKLIFAGMSTRYGKRIGVADSAVLSEHEKLVAALHLEATLPA